MPQAGDVVYLTGCKCCSGTSSSSSSSGSCPACQNCVVTKFEGVTYDDPDYTGTYYAGLYLTFYPTNSGCTKYSMDYYFDSDLVLHMEVDTIAGTLIVWDYQPDRGLLNPMAVYGAAARGSCPLGTYVFDHQGDGVLDATWPDTITLVNGSKTFGPETLPQAVEISWPNRCSYAPCTTSAVLSIVSSTYDVNGDVTQAQWSGGFCTTATGQITHQAVMDMNCGIITLTITRLSDGSQISDGILTSDPDSSWIDGEIVMHDLGNIAFTCAITTVNFTIGHRNGETMTVENCAACSTSSSSSSSSSPSSSSSSKSSSSSSKSLSSSSSSGCTACQCCVGFYFEGVSSPCDSHYSTYSDLEAWYSNGGYSSGPCTTYSFPGAYMSPGHSSLSGQVTAVLTVGSPSTVVFSLSSCSGHRATFTKSDGINGCIYGDYSLTSQTHGTDTWTASLTVVNTSELFLPSVPTTITITPDSACVYAGASTTWTMTLGASPRTACNFPHLAPYDTSIWWFGSFLDRTGLSASLQLNSQCGLWGSNIGIGDFCNGQAGSIVYNGGPISPTQHPFQFPPSGSTVQINPGLAGFFNFTCRGYVKCNPTTGTFTY